VALVAVVVVVKAVLLLTLLEPSPRPHYLSDPLAKGSAELRHLVPETKSRQNHPPRAMMMAMGEEEIQ
jgi:hypothetical protein